VTDDSFGGRTLPTAFAARSRPDVFELLT
jgi:hypothetical protein